MNEMLNKDELRAIKKNRVDFLSIPRNQIYIVLDNVKFLHNIGTIIRLADAVLAAKVYICGTVFNKKNRSFRNAVKGLDKWVDCEYYPDSVEVIKKLKAEKIKIVSAEIAHSSIAYGKLNLQSPIAIVFGNEKDGVSDEVLKLSDHIAHLPVLGMTNSINVATTASVFLYEILKNSYKYMSKY